MRITTGLYKGRTLTIPPGRQIRPTSDKMRQAIFNILFSYDLPGDAHVLDAFAGTGALGLEALSRGASHATFFDRDITIVTENVKKLKAEAQSSILKRDATKPGPATRPAQLAFLDPPYNLNLVPAALMALTANGWLAPSAIVVCETESAQIPAIPDGFEVLDERRYGAAHLCLLRYN